MARLKCIVAKLMCILFCVDGAVLSGNDTAPVPHIELNNDTGVCFTEVDCNGTDFTVVKSYLDMAVWPIYQMTTFFLEEIIQPRYITDLQDQVDFSDCETVRQSTKRDWKLWLNYLLGYTICVAIGAVLIVTMAITGIVILCCRCCGKCGGTFDPTEGENAKCMRTTLAIILFIITIIIIIGLVSTFIFNESFSNQLNGNNSMFRETGDGIDAISEYLDDTVHQLNQSTLGHFRKTKSDVMLKLDDVVNASKEILRDEISSLISHNRLEDFINNLTDLYVSLQTANSSFNKLKLIENDFDRTLVQLKNSTFQELNNCTAPSCNITKDVITSLTINPNLTDFNLSASLEAVNIALNKNMTEMLPEIDSTIKTVLEPMEEQLRTAVNSTRDILKESEKHLEEFVAYLDATVNSLTLNMESTSRYLLKLEEEVKRPSSIVYWILVVILSFLAIIVFCNLMAIVLAAICPRPSPGSGRCAADRAQGANFLLCGVCLSFLFYGIFTLIVTSLFVLGGIPHTEVCQHFVKYKHPANREVLQIYDSLFQRSVYNSTQLDISILNVTEACECNKTFYTALDMDERGFNLSHIVNQSAFQECLTELNETQTRLDPVQLVNPDVLNDLYNMENALQNELDFKSILEDLNRNITDMDLNSLSDHLIDNMNDTGNDTGGQNDSLLSLIAELQNISIGHGRVLRDLRSNMTYIQILLGDVDVDSIVSEINASEIAIRTKVRTVVSASFDNITKIIADDFVNLAKQIDDDVRCEIGRCRPIYDSFTTIIDATCIKTLYPVNGFWFALGWCIIFLIPSIIVSLKLVTQLRKSCRFIDVISYTDPIYDAYKTPDYYTYREQPREMLIDGANANKPGQFDMGYADNPLFIPDNDLEYRIPRPKVHALPYQFSTSEDNSSPPPSYRSGNEITDNDDTRL